MHEHIIPPVWRLLWFWILLFVAILSGWMLFSTLTNVKTTAPEISKPVSYVTEPTKPKEPADPTQDQLDDAIKRAEQLCTEKFLSQYEISIQLRSEGHHYKAVEYALNHLAVDWNETALKRAEDCALNQGKSQQEVSTEISTHFTKKELQYVLHNITADWNLAAKKRAKILSEEYGDSKQNIYEMLMEKNFSAQQAKYGVDYAEIDWNENALKHAKQFHLIDHMPAKVILTKLTSQREEQFTAEEANYAVTALQTWIEEGIAIQDGELADYNVSYPKGSAKPLYNKKFRISEYLLDDYIPTTDTTSYYIPSYSY